MEICRLLPFIDKAPRIKVHPNCKVASKDVTCEGFTKSNFKDTVYLVKPLNLLVSYRPTDKDGFISCDIIEIDYSYVADLITVQDNKALYPEYAGFIEEEIETDEFINQASNKVVIQDVGIKNGNVVVVPFKSTPINESLGEYYEASLASLKKKGNVPIPLTTHEQSSIDLRLESYLKGGYVTQRVLLLIGQSAVAKSARVKAIADKLGFRMIDLRTAFMTRLDLQGLTDIVYNSDGTVNSTQAPMSDIITCTDEYIRFCRKALPEIQKAYDKEQDPATRENIKRTLDNFTECSKPPILFLDEVTYWPPSMNKANQYSY